MEESIFVCEGL
jgi:hypothetical protein